MWAAIQRDDTDLQPVLGLKDNVVRTLHYVEAVIVGPGENGRSAAHGDASRAHADVPRSIRVHDSAAMAVRLDIVAVSYRSRSFHRLRRPGRHSAIRGIHN